MKYLLLFFILIYAAEIEAQSEWEKWGKEETAYSIQVPGKNEGADATNGFASGFLSILKSVYTFFISVPDGDNCPFYPSCSSFYVQAVNEEGIIKGTLMFADRFTRDMNFMKSHSRYSIHSSGKLFDPPRNYSLDEEKIIFSHSESRDKK